MMSNVLSINEPLGQTHESDNKYLFAKATNTRVAQMRVTCWHRQALKEKEKQTSQRCRIVAVLAKLIEKTYPCRKISVVIAT
jgi:hypothetical protein